MFLVIIAAIIFISAVAVGLSLLSKTEYEKQTDQTGKYVRNAEGYVVTKKVRPYKREGNLVLICGTIGAVFIVLLGCVCSVSTGHTGVVTTFGKVEDYTFESGLHFKNPISRVYQMDNRVQKASVGLECFSSDIQEVTCTYTINYQINKTNAQELYKVVGKNYYDTVITPNVAESVKTIMAHYTAEQLISNRDALGDEIEGLLRERMVDYNIEIVSTALEDIDFTDSFTNAVEAKQVAVQNKLKAATEQEQATMESQQKAERAVIDANAAADVAKIQAQADFEVQKINADTAEYVGQKEAAKNTAIANSLTPELVEYFTIQQWDGKYPTTYMTTDGANTMLNIPIGE